MSNAVEAIRQRLLRAARALDSHHIPYAVIGGNAVAAWVSRVDESAVRNTRDVDILLRREDLARAIVALEESGFIHRRVASISGGALDLFLDGPSAKARDAVHVVFAQENARPDSLQPAPDVMESEEAEGFRLIALSALVEMKLAAWRDKDRMHLRDMIDVGLLDETWPDRLAEPLSSRLQALIDQPE